MKLIRCDKCGIEAVGRNPEGFGEILIDHHYYDLCEDCKRKVNGIIYTFDLKKTASLRNYINTPMAAESESLANTVEKMVKLAEKNAENSVENTAETVENTAETRQDDGKNE